MHASGDLQHSRAALGTVSGVVQVQQQPDGTFDRQAGASEAIWRSFFHLIMRRRRLCLNHRAR
jgi:hypothetical protein